MRGIVTGLLISVVALSMRARGEEFPKPYGPPCTERENVFEFAEKPKVKNLGNDKYEITFAVKGNCDVTVGIVDGEGKVVRHLRSGVLGANAPAPFQKNSPRQTIYWNGKDDLDEYHKTPEKLKVRVMLGLKPEFDKRLGGVSPKNLPGYVAGIAIGPDGAYVFVKGPGSGGHMTVRKFDHDGNYLCALVPPPANVPEAKLNGMGFVEYEPGRRAVHSPDLYQTITDRANVMVDLGGCRLGDFQPVVFGDRVWYANCGNIPGSVSLLHYCVTDGSTETRGVKGKPLVNGLSHTFPRLAISPDGRWIYMLNAGWNSADNSDSRIAKSSVFRCSTEDDKPGEQFLGLPKGAPGSDNRAFNDPSGLDCDAQGRIYVADLYNNRIQVFSPEGTYLKTIPVDRPVLVRVHRKTGAVYVMHSARVEGKSVSCLSKYASFESSKPEIVKTGMSAGVLAVDSWTPKPRLWLGNGCAGTNGGPRGGGGSSLAIWEEEGGDWRKISDFDEEAKAEAGADYMGHWSGNGCGDKVVCDPLNERVYYGNSTFFDLKAGKLLGRVSVNCDDFIFDKRGYMHCHFNPGFYQQGVGRVDPSAPQKDRQLREVPYDYGEDGSKDKWIGIIRTWDQPGAKFFQDGIGVNMRGDVAENCNIYYVPKMDDLTHEAWWSGPKGREAYGESVDSGVYQRYQREFEEIRKGRIEVYTIRRQPGVPLCGATIWTFERSGDLRRECAVLAGSITAGSQIDEDGSVYFANCRIRLFNNVPFLAGRAGIYGDTSGRARANPLTGVLVKTKPDTPCRALEAGAPIPLDPPPDRPADAVSTGNVGGRNTWYEGAEWVYAGASPICPPGGCTCPTQRPHLDWYKRVFVPEIYRHSIGVLDTAGNLIMHLGRYGNVDSGNGAQSKLPTDGDNIAMFAARMISGTDNYLCFEDWGERLVVLKLNYHAEETVGIKGDAL